MEKANSTPVISIQNIGMRYGNNPEVLSDVYLDIHKGEFIFLTGESGAGKTSLLSLFYMENKAIRGKVSILNNNIASADRDKISFIRRRIGVIFQDYMLLDHLSVYDNIALPLRILGKSEKYIQRNVLDILHWIEMEKHIDSKPPSLSGGQKQRVAIARAVIHNPEILIADEPTGSVDDKMALKLLYLFVELNKRGTTVIISTHSKALIKKFNFKVVELNKGKVVKDD